MTYLVYNPKTNQLAEFITPDGFPVMVYRNSKGILTRMFTVDDEIPKGWIYIGEIV